MVTASNPNGFTFNEDLTVFSSVYLDSKGKFHKIGATDEVREGRWLWSDGSEITYKNWSAVGGQPNGSAANDQDYLLMMVKKSSMTKASFPAGEWFDQPDAPKNQGLATSVSGMMS